MAEIVNLRRARRARDRAEGEARAAANRSKFGRPKAEREAAEAEARRKDAALEAHRREPDDP